MKFIEQRLKTCETCPKSFSLISADSDLYCRTCGCSIKKLIANPWNNCPENVWLAHADPRDLEKIVINDAFFALQNPTDNYARFILQEFERRFPNSDPSTKYHEQVHENS